MAVTLNASTSSGFVQSADTSGEIFLQNNGTTRLSVLSTGVSGTLIQGTAVASTSGTAIDFTSIPSWVKRITVIFQGVSLAQSGQVQVRLGTSGGVVATGYSGSVFYGNTGGSTAMSTGFLTDGVAIGAAGLRNNILSVVNISGNSWVFSGLTVNTDSGTSIAAGNLTLGGTLDRVRITTLNGTDTFDAGTINIQYEG